METQHIMYKGYVIVPLPSQGAGEQWHSGYEIRKGEVPIRVRRNLDPGMYYSDAALNESIERAKLEIDNLAGAGAAP